MCSESAIVCVRECGTCLYSTKRGVISAELCQKWCVYRGGWSCSFSAAAAAVCRLKDGDGVVQCESRSSCCPRGWWWAKRWTFRTVCLFCALIARGMVSDACFPPLKALSGLNFNAWLPVLAHTRWRHHGRIAFCGPAPATRGEHETHRLETPRSWPLTKWVLWIRTLMTRKTVNHGGSSLHLKWAYSHTICPLHRTRKPLASNKRHSYVQSHFGSYFFGRTQFHNRCDHVRLKILSMLPAFAGAQRAGNCFLVEWNIAGVT